MTPEKILEIARRYTSPEEESSILIDEDGNPTGGTLNMMMWNFCEEELLAFAQSITEADHNQKKRDNMNDELTREELLEMVARQMETINWMRTQNTEALQAIDNGCPDLAWRKLLLVQERFQ